MVCVCQQYFKAFKIGTKNVWWKRIYPNVPKMCQQSTYQEISKKCVSFLRKNEIIGFEKPVVIITELVQRDFHLTRLILCIIFRIKKENNA